MTAENKSKAIHLNDIAVIYGLGVEAAFKSQVICDLNQESSTNPEGLAKFVSYNVKTSGDKCALCEDKSVPITVEGDVFLLEKPAVSTYLIKRADLPVYIKNFIGFYRTQKNQKAFLRAHYKENANFARKYELFIDIESLLDSWLQTPAGDLKTHKVAYQKLEKSIVRSFPASLKYIITLSDTASRRLAELIVSVLASHGAAIDNSCIVPDTDLSFIDRNQPGMIAVVSASVVTGRNLLFLSRALREYEKAISAFFQFPQPYQQERVFRIS
ncbi:hypothetical protein MKQ70_16655 [Chitinophaga sedimenti]|uniref:hypothetical protein n=1 Tax=Chitinophaga sedimenti TaxID=2033606 RepID=UPI0020049CD0|nr:hypothetical protein [Chitinophaga sedimenti]MCK7556559.1 hypothetical protein [Chitinophaga sedimenti]